MGEERVVFRLRPLDPARPLLPPMAASDVLLTAIRRTVVVSCVLFAALSLFVGYTHALSAPDVTTRGVTSALALGALGAAIWVLRARDPLTGRGAIALGVFADLGVVVTLGVIDDPVFAAYAVSALVLPGVFAMVHLGRSWLVAHLVLALATIGVLCARVVAVGDEAPAVAVAGGLLAVAVIVVTPWTMRLSFLHILDRAERAFYDPVTGVLNRWGLEAALDAVHEASPTAPVTVVVVDIDRFKSVNDVHGHECGDRVLRAVADDLAAFAAAREGVVARTGGEEFAVVLPGGLDDLAHVPAESPSRGSDPSVTLSSGVVTTTAGALAADDASGPLAEADLRMYAAKRAGGGRATR